MTDRYDTWAEIAGAAADLPREQWPGLAHVFRVIARDEREACALEAEEILRQVAIVEGDQPALREAREIARRIRART